MSPDITDLDWIAERRPDVIEPDDAVTDHTRTALMEHLAAPAATPAPLRDRRRAWRRTRRPLSLGLAAAAAADGVFVAVNVSSGGGGSLTEAQAAKIVAHARRSLAATPGLVQARRPQPDRRPDAMLDGRPAMLVTLHFPGGTVWRLWVDPRHADRPLRLTSSGGAGPQTATTTWHREYR
jgi:hypothetical protein